MVRFLIEKNIFKELPGIILSTWFYLKFPTLTVRVSKVLSVYPFPCYRGGSGSTER